MTLNNTISQLSIFSSKMIMKLLDSEKLEIYELQQWLDNLYYQTIQESKIKKERCEICHSREEPDNLELHHPSGKKHDYRTITVCLICHRWLTERQDIWDKRWLNEDLPDNLRGGFFLLGLQDVLILKSYKTGKSLYSNLAYSYNEKISTLLGRWQN